MSHPALEVPVDPSSPFRTAAARHVSEVLEERGLDPDTARGLVGKDPLPGGPPAELLEEGLREVVEGLSVVLDPSALERDLKGVDTGFLADAVLWRLSTARATLEALENVLSAPHVADALELWAAGLALRVDDPHAATSILASLTWGCDAPTPPVRFGAPGLREALDLLGSGLVRVSLAAHALANREVSPSVVARVLPEVEVPEMDVGAVKPFLDVVRNVTAEALEETVRREVERGEEPGGLELLGIEDPEGFFERVSGFIGALVEGTVRVAERLEPGELSGCLTRAEVEPELAGETWGPDSYDPVWNLWERARERLERDLGVLDASTEEALRRVLEAVNVRESTVDDVVSYVEEALETGREVVERALETVSSWFYGGKKRDRR